MKSFAELLLKANAWLLVLLPVQLRFFLGDIVGWLWFDLLRVRRNIVLDNLKLAYPEWTDEQRLKVGRSSVYHLGRSLIEFLMIPAMDTKNTVFKDMFRIEGVEYLERAKAKGLGVCLLAQHVGNGDFATAGMALNGIQIVLISKLFKIKWLNELWFGIRAKLGTEFIPPRNSSYAILKSLKNNETVAFVLDQFMGPPIGVRTQFFGHETGTAMGLAVMVSRSKAPVIPIYFYREQDGTTIVRFEEEIPFEEKETKELTVTHMTQVYTDKVESVIRMFPKQWMWVHKRWKEFKE